ncbi:replication restart DNA helicase PriA [Butyrivibrio sp. ob235]|uniref:replication restart helicase PriA n=1 Tax=Butyrivibrio sp. ob235 TaxID=1761780 RepID=UPI0008C34C23|nr:primosomal protein N' [Butyrivibrio sp. ob235]SEL19082.1 replication restart DNA helicase PriA [Butyrivibrio sp. ob235]
MERGSLSFANIIIDISHEKVDRPFQYKIPDRLLGKIEIGCCVSVPFGRGNTKRQGYVIGITDVPEFDPEKTKEILDIEEGEMSAEGIMIALAAWMRKTYGSTMINALRTVIPVRKKSKALVKRYVRLAMSEAESRDFYENCVKKHQVARARLLEALLEDTGERIPYELVTGKLNVSAAVIRALSEKGVIATDSEEYYRNPVGEVNPAKKDITLSQEQQEIVDTVISNYDKGIRETCLIHGITGSGKTEVYIKMIDEIIARGKQAIVLIPEIALTYQTLMRFYRHFGERVSVMNSTLSPGEKYDQAKRAAEGDIDIIIGPRSALFTPFPNVGLIIIDEEHESTYKSETMPKYHARETAIELAKLVPGGADVILGSATPSLETYYRAKKGEYRLFELNRRLTGGTLPDVEIADLREELRSGNRSIFSRSLQERLQETLDNGHQAMLFINRRGLAGFVSCRSCGYVFKCPHCDVSMSEHRGGMLMCHYCGHTQPIQKICPECGSKYVSAFRAGTQQIEKEVLKFFPKARVLRMDADTTRTKGSYEKILSAFAAEEADVLVGTQMIVKGHDFPNVTLVGILAADMSLNASDYRAGERTFQLLTQAAGRAGRGKVPGNVVIQSYQPDNYAIVSASKQDYKAFYEEEISYRELLRYPPAAHMLAIQLWAKDEDFGKEKANQLRAFIDRMRIQNAIIIGPAPATIGKINDIYRMVIYVKHEDFDRLTLIKDTLEEALSEWEKLGYLRNLQVQFDFDPMNFM